MMMFTIKVQLAIGPRSGVYDADWLGLAYILSTAFVARSRA